eukprot:GHVQ01008993.1.p1 GENE.GHVQ01008993.1~~GHVQ01008993.1.p1  ORF type:complete len:105 (-),score=8.70 GHVQ01008993.1:93-407(-)
MDRYLCLTVMPNIWLPQLLQSEYKDNEPRHTAQVGITCTGVVKCLRQSFRVFKYRRPVASSLNSHPEAPPIDSMSLQAASLVSSPPFPQYILAFSMRGIKLRIS